MKEYLIYVVYIIYAVLVIYGIQKKSIDIHEKAEYLTRLNSLRGLLALDIIIGHVAGQNMFPLMPFEKFSIVSVASFFFLSGMGLSTSYYKKENYLTQIPEKIIYLIGVTMILYLAKIGVQFISGADLDYIPGNVSQFIKFYLIKTNWYIWEFIILYIIFALVYKFIRLKALKILAIFIVSFLLGICFLLNNFIVAWYYSILGFPFGVLFSECC